MNTTPLTSNPQRALELAVRDYLVAANLGYEKSQVGICYNGQPPPACGNLFLAIWSDGRVSNGGADGRYGMEAIFAVNVTLTIRISGVPFDRWQDIRHEIHARTWAIAKVIQKDCFGFPITRLASSYLESPLTNQFVEPLCWLNNGHIQDVASEWFWAEPSRPQPGMSQTVYCGKSRWVSELEGL